MFLLRFVSKSHSPPAARQQLNATFKQKVPPHENGISKRAEEKKEDCFQRLKTVCEEAGRTFKENDWWSL